MLTDNDSSWVAYRAHDMLNIIQAEWTKPSVMFGPRIFLDGNEWCCLLGDNMQVGIVGFGFSPEHATLAFDRAWYEKTKEATQ